MTNKPIRSGAMSDGSAVNIEARLRQLVETAHVAVAAACGIDAPRGIDVTRRLGLDPKLAWKLTRIANARDPFECVRYLPGDRAWEIVGARLRAHGVDAGLIGQLLTLAAEVRVAGRRWAGSPSAFVLMAAGVVAEGDPAASLEHRRNHWQSGSYIWGMRMRTMVRLDVFTPAADGRNMQGVTIRGFVDVERLRPDAPWYLEVPFVADDATTAQMPVRFEPLDATDARAEGPSFMRRYCSKRLPQFARSKKARTPVVMELPVGAVGMEDRFTLFHGARIRGELPMHRTPENQVGSLMQLMHTPTASLVFDLLIHRDIAGHLPTLAPKAFGVIDGWRGQFSVQSRDRIPMPIVCREIGAGRRDRQSNACHELPDIIETAIGYAGCPARDLRHFRTEIAYPPIPSAVVYEFPLLD